ncbi:MAG TPA: fibronectin type III domain-containing protein, partial [Chitinophagaceae bacterium]|nr:fibronectin type III domain-containing protein [Chitinophagaceae bacterium]
MKAILCNTATDAGNQGPDFSYGFGQMNLYRAVKAIDNSQYFLDSVAHMGVKTRSFTVPEGAAQLKLMLYWPDPAANILSSKSLVNDLDITVTGPTGTLNLPYRLDTTAANVANPATRGEDHVNNVEQVVIDFPQAGNYIVNVKGTEIGQNEQQQFYVTYDILPNKIMLTFPFGNEALVPNENITIQWDSWGTGNSTFTLEFSDNNGASWQMIDNTIGADKRKFDWQLPNVTTTNALLKLTRNSDLQTTISGKFTIVGVPVISLAANQCPGHISLQWNAVTGVDHYEIMRVANGEMVTVDTTSSLSYVIRNLSVDSTYWVTVRSVINNLPGRRAYALSRKPDSGNCSDAFFDYNLKADTLMAPLTGRNFTSSQLSANQHIVIQIKNLDNQPAINFTVSHSVNGSNWATENVNVTIAAGASYTYTSSGVYDLSQPGEYIVLVAVKNSAPDPDAKNDTLRYIIRSLDNQPVSVATPFIEKFEQAVDTIYSHSFIGLRGIDRFDYQKNSPAGRIRFPTNELSDTSGRSLKFDLPFPGGTNFTDDAIIATYNLSGYDVTINDVGLSFTYSSLLASPCTNCPDTSKIFIRGNDTSPWIPVMLFNSTTGAFINKRVEAIELADILASSGQNFSSAFQVRLSHTSGYYKYLFDDITLYNASNDLALVSIDSINLKSCNIGSIPLRITVKNNSKNAAVNVPVHYKIDNGSTVTETIASIPANTSLPYTFAATANLATNGFHTIEAWISYASDPYSGNNVKKITLRNQPLINTFPYLENFEASNGFFYTEGINSSWEYGHPSSPIIKQAASGSSAWKTNLDGRYNSDELSYLYSPCIDYSALQNPVISISLALNLDSCISANFCDYMRAQYSTDGINWTSFPLQGGLRYNWPSLWNARNYYRWHVASQFLPVNQPRIQFRFLFNASRFVNYEGAAIDDFHIYDLKNPIYDTTLAGVSLSRSITGGNNWTEFLQDQKIIASINPYGQNLGTTVLKTYINPPMPAADFHGQYYLNRSFIITAENRNPADSIGIRLYYLDREADSLLFAGNCIKCSKPEDAYRFGVSKYSTDSLGEENENISDNINGRWLFIENRKVKIVPYEKGYYAEFKVKDLSEFRLNSGGPDKQSYLPANILSFSAIKSSNATTDLAWTIASEINIVRYEIEVAKGNEAFANDQFTLLGQVSSPGATAQNRSYSFADITPGKTGVLYYRIKIIDEFGNYSYSRSIPVLFSQELS